MNNLNLLIMMLAIIPAMSLAMSDDCSSSPDGTECEGPYGLYRCTSGECCPISCDRVLDDPICVGVAQSVGGNITGTLSLP